MSMYHGSTGFNTENNYADPSVITAGAAGDSIERHQSTGNLFSIAADDISDDNDEMRDRVQDQNHLQMMSNIMIRKPFDSKVPLTNAKTLRPYMKLRNKFVELVPIFYKRNPKKTRNSLAQSIHSIHFLNEMDTKNIDMETLITKELARPS